jgi:hypothetical protein
MTMKVTAKNILSTHLALGLLLTPAMALADNNVMTLKPMQQESTVYSTGAAPGNPAAATSTNLNANPNLNGVNNNMNGGYGLPNYGSSYYTPSSTETPTLSGHITSIPKGTTLSIQTDSAISSYAGHIGDPINATLENDLYINDNLAVPAGSQVQGQVANISNASMMGKHGSIDVRFDNIKLQDGRVIPINAHIVTHDKSGVLKGDSFAMDVAKGVGIAAGTTGAGVLMGTAAGSLLGSAGTGALFGLGVGALGGMGYAMARKGKDVIVPAGSRMNLIIDSPVTVNN